MWSLGKAPNPGAFYKRALKFAEKYPEAHAYLLGGETRSPTCDKESWTRAFFPLPRYGQLTCNICESFNNAITKERGKQPECSNKCPNPFGHNKRTCKYNPLRPPLNEEGIEEEDA